MVLFTANQIKDGFKKSWCNQPHELKKASYFSTSRRPSEIQNTAVLGVLISITQPKKNSNGSGSGGMKFSSMAATGVGGKLQRVYSTPNYEIILQFADMSDLPNCFAVIFDYRRQYFALFKHCEKTDYIKLGDAIVFREPQPHDEKLGKMITVLKNPSIAAAVTYSHLWPIQQPLQAPQDNEQVAFHAANKRITVCNGVLLTSMDHIKCANKTCDMQNIDCAGCFGSPEMNKPMVIECDVEVMDCPLYDNAIHVATFWSFRSLRFSHLFFNSLEDISSKGEDIHDEINQNLRNSMTELVNYINNRNGWTLFGWHRRGSELLDNGETRASVKTKGHLVYLMPTNMADAETPFFREHRIATPDFVVAPPNGQNAPENVNAANNAGADDE